MDDNQNIANSSMAVKEARRIMLDFLRDNFDSEKISAAENLINNCPVYIVDQQELKKQTSQDEIYDKAHVEAFASDNGIFIPHDMTYFSPEEEWDQDRVLTTIIHEYAHKLRKINSNYGNMFEEGFATVFAVACVNYSKIKEQLQNNQNVTQPETYTNTDWQYRKAESQIRSILYILNQKGLDVALIGEYIFGDQTVFKQKCAEIFGKEFETYFELANSRDDQYYNNFEDQQRNSETQLINILANYMRDNQVNLQNYWNRDHIFLGNRASITLAHSVVEAGVESIREEDKEAYRGFESLSNYDKKETKEIVENRVERIRNIVLSKYSLSGKSIDDIYSTLCDLCAEYIQRKNSDKKENHIFIEEIKKLVPDIEDLSKRFVELRRFTTSSAIFENIKTENISYSAMNDAISYHLEQFKRKELIDSVSTKFNDTDTSEDLFKKISELSRHSSEIDQILPNYSDFIKFVSELNGQIPERFSNEVASNYESLYKEILSIYISKKEHELIQSKQLEENYRKSSSQIDTQYKVVSNESDFYKIKAKDEELNGSLSSEQQVLEQENQNRLENQEKKDGLIDKRDNLQKKNAIVRFFKRKEINDLSNQILELNQKIESNELSLEQIRGSIAGIQKQISENERQLVDLCGLTISDYTSILEQCKAENLTQDQLLERAFAIQKNIEALNISGREQELLNIYSKNGLIRKTEEQIIESSQGIKR